VIAQALFAPPPLEVALDEVVVSGEVVDPPQATAAAMLPRPNFASASRLFMRPSHLAGDVILPVDRPQVIAVGKQHAANTIATIVCRMTSRRAGSLPRPVAAH
jgi:hypothetical protein